MLKAIWKMLSLNLCAHQYETIDTKTVTHMRRDVSYSDSVTLSRGRYVVGGRSTVYTSRCKHCGRITSTKVSF